MNIFKEIWFALTSSYRVRIGINSAVSITVIGVLIYYFVLKTYVDGAYGLISEWYNPESGWHALALGVVAGVVATILFGFLSSFAFGWLSKTRLTGKYQAFDIDQHGNETPWGTVTIKFHPLSKKTDHIPVHLQLNHDNTVMEGDGLIVDNRFLIGHYTDTGNPERRRSGSLMYEKDGNGTSWEGDYLFVDPDIANPTSGHAKWVRI